jgi:hypothetical protein
VADLNKLRQSNKAPASYEERCHQHVVGVTMGVPLGESFSLEIRRDLFDKTIAFFCIARRGSAPRRPSGPHWSHHRSIGPKYNRNG